MRLHSAASVMALVSATMVVVMWLSAEENAGQAQGVPFVVLSSIPVASSVDAPGIGPFITNLSAAAATANDTTVVAIGSLSGKRFGALLGNGTSSVSYVPISSFLPGERVDLIHTNGIQALGSGAPLSPHAARFVVAAGKNAGAFGGAMAFGVAPTAALPSKSILAADFDGDGDIDLIESAGGVEIRFWENLGTGALAALSSQLADLTNQASRLHAVDLDGDGLPEIWESRAPLNDRLWKWAGFGAYNEVMIPAISSQRAASGDFNRDGRMDIVTISSGGTRVALNDGALMATSNHRLIHLSPQNDVATGDIDGDGDTDIVVAGSALTVLRNEGYGVFSVAPSTFAMGVYRGIACADMDGDGRDDIIAVALTPVGGSPSTGVYLSKASQASFVRVASPMNLVAGSTLAIGDLDGDGSLDMVIGGTSQPSVTTWLNDGTGRMTSGGNGVVGGTPGSLALVDMDGDGVLDLVNGKAAGESSWHKYSPFDGNSMLSMVGAPITMFASSSIGPQVVMSWSIVDVATSDTLPTVVTDVMLDLTGSTADANEGAWVLSGIGLLPVQGVVVGEIGSQRLEFSDIAVAAPSSQFTTLHLTLDIVAGTANVTDGQVFHIALDHQNVKTSHLGSQLAREAPPITNTGLEYRVTASKLMFREAAPALVQLGSTMDAEVLFTDDAGVIDRDVNGDVVTLMRGGMAVASAVAVNGVASFVGLNSIALAAPSEAGIQLTAHDDVAGSVDLSHTTAVSTPIDLLDADADCRLEIGPGVERTAVDSIQNQPVLAFDFRIRDLGVNGSSASKVNSIRLNLAGSTAPASAATWTVSMYGQPLVQGVATGTLGSEVIEFEGAWPIAQGGSRVFQVYCLPISTLSPATDKSRWKMSVDAGSFDFSAGGFYPGQTTVNNGAGMEFVVSATMLRFVSTPPLLAYPTDPFEFSVEYTDAHGNRDVDVNGDRVFVSRSDGGGVLQGQSLAVVAGVARFADHRAVVLGGGSVAPFSLELRDNSGGTITVAGAPLVFGPMSLAAASRSDVNFDGIVDVVDVQQVVNMILNPMLIEYPGHGDANGDSIVDVVDVQTIVNKILGN